MTPSQAVVWRSVQLKKKKKKSQYLCSQRMLSLVGAEKAKSGSHKQTSPHSHDCGP